MKFINKQTISVIVIIGIFLMSSMYTSTDLDMDNFQSLLQNENIKQDLSDGVFDDISIPEVIDTEINDTTYSNTTVSVTSIGGELIDTEMVYQAESVKVDYKSKNVTVKSLDYSYKTDFEFLLKWGTYGTGNGEFNNPYGVAVDSNSDVYVADTSNNRIQKFDNLGNYILQWGTSGTGNGEFNNPFGIAVDSNSSIYITDIGNNRIQKFDNLGNYILQWGSSGTGNGEFGLIIRGVAVDSNGDVYVADTNNNRIQKFDNLGNYILQWSSAYPFGITVDSNSDVYVTEASNDRVKKFDNLGNYILQWGTSGTGNGEFDDPMGIAVDSNSDVYVTDFDNGRVQKFDNLGNYILQWGTSGSGDGEFDNPYSLAVDSDGSIYVADASNSRIQKFGFITTTIVSEGMLPNAVDDDNLIFNNVKSGGTIYEEAYIGFTCYDMIAPSQLGILFSWETKRTGIYTSIFTDEELTINLSDESIYSNDELKVYFVFSYGINGNFTAEIITFDTGSNQYISNTTISNTAYFDEFDNSIIKIDYVWAESQEIGSDVRSDLKYSSPVQSIHIIDVDVFDYRVPLAIYIPLSWNFSSITPSATVTWDDIDKYYYITNTIPTTYTITFMSGDGWGVDYSHQQELLFIHDVSLDYISNPSFETDIFGDWRSPDTNYFDDVSSETGVVSAGSLSMQLNDTDSASDYLFLDDIGSGAFYISFDYYVEEIGAGDFRLEHPTGVITIATTSTITDRWHKFTGYIEVNTSTYDWIRFWGYNFIGEIYIDNFGIWQDNIEVITVAKDTYQFSSTLINFDGYKFPAVPNKQVQLKVYNDTDIIIEVDVITDEFGVASFTYIGSDFTEQMYTVEFTDFDSWWGTPWTYTDLMTCSNWDDASTCDVTDNSIDFSYSASTDVDFNPSGTWDISYIDYFVLQYLSDDDDNQHLFYFIDSNVKNRYWIFNNDPDVINTEHQNFDEDYSVSASTFDHTILDEIRFNWDSTTTNNINIYDFHFVQSQKMYFVPQLGSKVDVEIEDFSKHRHGFTDLDSDTDEMLDGYLNITSTGNDYWGYYTQYSTDFEYSISARINRTGGNDQYIGLSFYDEPLTTPSDDMVLVRTDTFQTIFRVNGIETNPVYFTESYEWILIRVDVTEAQVKFYVNNELVATRINTNDLGNPYVGIHGYDSDVIVDFFRFSAMSSPSIYTTDTAFYVTSVNNTLMYVAYSDDTYIGTYGDLTLIPLDTGTGDHNLTIVPIYNTDPYSMYIVEETGKLEYLYSAGDFQVSVQSFTLSDYYVQTYVVSTDDGTYIAYENNTIVGSGSYLSSGTSIQTIREIETDIFINYAISFTDGTTIVWFNSSYSNAEVPPAGTPPVFVGDWYLGESILVGTSIGEDYHLRSYYQYLTDGIKHVLWFVPSITLNYVNISVPSDWKNISISPNIIDSNIDQDIDTIKVYSGVDYVLTAYSGDVHNIVALTDITSDYMIDQSFETIGLASSTTGGWKYISSNPYDSAIRNNTIVKDGEYSLQIIDTDSSNDWLMFYLDYGAYYISFDYYIVQASSTLRLENKIDDGWEYHNLDTTLDRWHTMFVYIEVDTSYLSGTDWYNILLSSAGSSLEMYIDNFRIKQSSGVMNTIGYNEYQPLSTFIEWDNRMDNPKPYHTVQWSLWNRPDNIEIISETLVTNENGVAFTLYQGILEQLEYENRWYSEESDFNSNYLDKIDFDIDDEGFTGGSTEVFDNTNTYKITTIASTTVTMGKVFSTLLDYDDDLLLSFRVYSEDSGSGWQYRFVLYDSIGNHVYFDIGDLLELNNFKTFTYDMSESTSAVGVMDGVKTFNINHYSYASDEYIYWDYIKFIMPQKSYFTPISGDLPYSYETKQSGEPNYWDYSENAVDGWESYTSTDSFEIDNGTVMFSADGLASYYAIRVDVSDVDTAYYNNLKVRVKTNSTDEAKLDVWDSTIVNRIVDTTPIVYSTYGIYEFELNSNWDGSETYLNILIRDSDSATEDNDTSWIDYVMLFHKTHNSGYAWEFEEPDVVDPFNVIIGGDLANVKVKNGKFYGEHTGDAQARGYTTTTHALERPPSTNYDIEIKITSTATTEIRFYFYRVDSQTWNAVWYDLYEGDNVITFDYYIESSGIGFALQSGIATAIEIEYIRFVLPEPVNLYGTYDSFVFSSTNNTAWYYFELDAIYGTVKDLTYISKNMSVGLHNFSYVPILDDSIDSNLLQIPSTWYYYQYEIEDPFIVTVTSFSLSDEYAQLYAVATHDYSYTAYDNRSGSLASIATGSGLSTGTSLQIERTTEIGLIMLSVKFYTSINYVWFNTSYSNAEPTQEIFQLINHDIDIDQLEGIISVFIETNWQNTTVQVYDNGTSLGDSKPEGYSIWGFNNSALGFHNITVYIMDDTTEYATLILGDAWDFTIDTEGFTTNEGSVITEAGGELYIDLAGDAPDIIFPITSIDADKWNVLIFTTRAFSSGYTLQLFDNTGLLLNITDNVPTSNTQYTIFLEGFGWTGTRTSLYFQISEVDNPFDATDSVWFDNIALEDRPDIDEAMRDFGVSVTVETIYGELYVSFANPLGVGISPELVTLYIDNVRKPTGIGLKYKVGQNITIDIKDYYGQLLGTTSVVMSTTTFVDIAISLYEQILYNNGTVAVVVQVQRSDGLGGTWNITLNSFSSMAFLTFRSTYNLTVVPLLAERTEEIGGEVFEVIYSTKNYDEQELGLRAITIVADTQATALIGGISGRQISDAIDGEGVNWDLLITALITPLLTILVLGFMWYMATIGKLFFTKLVYGITLMFGKKGFNPEDSMRKIGAEQTKLDLIQMLDPEHRENVARIIYSSPLEMEQSSSTNNNGNGDIIGVQKPRVQYKITPKNRV